MDFQEKAEHRWECEEIQDKNMRPWRNENMG